MEGRSPQQVDRDWLFPAGANGFGDSRLGAGSYVRGWNVVCRGGVIRTRPGTRVMAALPPGRPQCLTEFVPFLGHRQLIAVIDGRVYVLEHPFNRWRQLPDIQLSARADVVYHAECVQVVERTAEGGTTFLYAPRRVLVLQDGLSPAGWYDGYDHGNDRFVDGIPIGTRMAWVENRLWVARNNQVYASDFANPRSFAERFYLGEADSLIYPDEVTALKASDNAALGQTQLMVWTRSEAHIVSAAVPRTAWPTTANFSRRLFKIGCISQRSVVEHEGKIWWMTANGLTSLDESAQSQVSAATPVIDRAMAWSKAAVDAREQRTAGCVSKGYLLMSVAYSDQANTHTWCLDTAVTHGLQEQAKPAWASVWTGFKPVEWVVSNDRGTERVFALCTNPDSGENQLIEALLDDRRDTGQDIECAVELRTYTGPDPRMKRFDFAEVLFSEIEGEVEFAVSYRGLARGRYQRVLRTIAKAARGVFEPDVEVVAASTVVEAFGSQMRRYQTEEPREQEADALGGSSSQFDFVDGLDLGFGFLVQWSGSAALRDFGVVLSLHTERVAGAPPTDETTETVVRWDGAIGTREALEEAEDAFPIYAGQWTESADWRDDVAVVVNRESLISPSSAERMARQGAIAQIDYWRERDAPSILGGTA